jgi:hypothetical protein
MRALTPLRAAFSTFAVSAMTQSEQDAETETAAVSLSSHPRKSIQIRCQITAATYIFPGMMSLPFESSEHHFMRKHLHCSGDSVSKTTSQT